jgi:hypothetical protein
VKNAKQEAHEIVDTLPDDVSLDAIGLELQFRASVLRGLEQAARGEGLSHEDVKRRLAAWLESSGPLRFSKT